MHLQIKDTIYMFMITDTCVNASMVFNKMRTITIINLFPMAAYIIGTRK